MARAAREHRGFGGGRWRRGCVRGAGCGRWLRLWGRSRTRARMPAGAGGLGCARPFGEHSNDRHQEAKEHDTASPDEIQAAIRAYKTELRDAEALVFGLELAANDELKRAKAALRRLSR